MIVRHVRAVRVYRNGGLSLPGKPIWAASYQLIYTGEAKRCKHYEKS